MNELGSEQVDGQPGMALQCGSALSMAAGTASAASVPSFQSFSFEEAIRLFKQWGFVVEPGPRPEEVTLILEGPGCRTYSVYDAQMLPQIAATALGARWQSGALTTRAWQRVGAV